MSSKSNLKLLGAGKLSFSLMSCTALTVAGGSAAMAQSAGLQSSALAAGAVIAASDSAPAQGASADQPALSEVIVTAQKRGENLQKVPISVAAFSATTLAAQNVTGLSDLATITPTLRFSYSGPVGSPYLRGIGSSESFVGNEAEVQTYIDNVYYGSGAAAFMKFNNIDRIEVDKGPQGTLFGRNATGGVIQIFTRDPSPEPKLDASIGYGNYNAAEADVYASDGFGDKVAADVAIHYDDHDGWGKNVYLNRDEYTARDFGIRSKWVFKPFDTTKVTFIIDYDRDRSDLGSTLVRVEAPWRASLAQPLPPTLDDYSVSSDLNTFAQLTHAGASLKIDQKFGDLTFSSISAYQDTKSVSLIDADATSTYYTTGAQHTTEEQLSQEFQLAPSAKSRLQWIAGAYFYYDRASEDPASLSGGLFAPFGATRIDNYSTLTTKSAALYGQATYDITPKTHITGGLRYTYDERDQTSHVIFQYPNGPSAPPPFLGLGANKYPSADFKAPTGKITISQDLSDGVMAYVGYSRGFKSGTFNNLIILSNPGPALKPEYLDAYEGGIKSELFDGRLRANVSAFYYSYTNQQVNVFQSLSISLQNAASSSIKGVDGDFQYALTRNTHLMAGLAFLDATYDSFPNAPLYTIIPPTSPNPAVRGFGGLLIGEASANGKTLPEAPKFSGNLGVNHKVEFNTGRLDLNAGVAFQSRVYFTPDNLYSQSPYATLTASAKWTSADRRWDFTLWGRNLTGADTHAQLSLSSYGVLSYPNEPRSYGAKVGVHF